MTKITDNNKCETQNKKKKLELINWSLPQTVFKKLRTSETDIKTELQLGNSDKAVRILWFKK